MENEALWPCEVSPKNISSLGVETPSGTPCHLPQGGEKPQIYLIINRTDAFPPLGGMKRGLTGKRKTYAGS